MEDTFLSILILMKVQTGYSHHQMTGGPMLNMSKAYFSSLNHDG